MRTIKVKVDCLIGRCKNCALLDYENGNWLCRAYTDKGGFEYLMAEVHGNYSFACRCQRCLDAEVKEKGDD